MGNHGESDSRLELEIDGNQIALQNWTGDGHSVGDLALGIKTVPAWDVLELQLMGNFHYGGKNISFV